MVLVLAELYLERLVTDYISNKNAAKTDDVNRQQACIRYKSSRSSRTGADPL